MAIRTSLINACVLVLLGCANKTTEEILWAKGDRMLENISADIADCKKFARKILKSPPKEIAIARGVYDLAEDERHRYYNAENIKLVADWCMENKGYFRT